MFNFRGCYVAMVTPFDENGNVNFEKIEELVEMHIKWGTRGLVPIGTTGENPTLTNDERMDIMKCVVITANKRIPIIVGTGSNCTRTAVQLTEMAKEVGADAGLVVVPYYNKPSQDGMKEHFKELDKVGLPLVAYNLPGRTGVNMLPETLIQISKECKNVIAIKESSGNIDQITEIACSVPKEFSILSGDDSLILPILSVGGVGVVSVAGNFIPYMIQDMINKYFDGMVSEAQEIHKKIFPICKALLTLDSNPVAVKSAMNILGYNVGGTRLPLTKLDSQKEDILKNMLINLGLVK